MKIASFEKYRRKSLGPLATAAEVRIAQHAFEAGVLAVSGGGAAQEPACEHCDGSGDVHDETGEWRGYCICPAGVALRKLRAAANALAIPSEAKAETAEPVRIWIDCEFNEHEGRHDLISMALVAEDGREWYEVLHCAAPGSWVLANVMPRLGKSPISRGWMSRSLADFLAPYPAVRVVADWPSDIALFCDALITGPGERVDTPPLTLEVVRLDGVSANPHNALADARAIRDVHLSTLRAEETSPSEAMRRDAERWRPIETAPKDGTRIQLHRREWKYSQAVCWWSRDFEEWRVAASGASFLNATSWMPLPSPPSV